MSDFTFWEILSPMLVATRWTLALSLAAFVGGGLLGIVIMLLRLSRKPWARVVSTAYVELFQGTPLLIQLFVCYFGIAIMGLELSAFVSATIALTLFSAAYLGEIWRGCAEAIPRGQWEASASLAMSYRQQMIHVIGPQAVRIALAPTVGFMVQIVKGTSLTAIVGFIELSRTGMNLSNATFKPFLIYGLLGVIYFALCFPLSAWSHHLEKRLGTAGSH